MTYVGPGRRSHSSFSSARRYLARIFVSASISEMSIRARMRASRRVAPMSGIAARKATGAPVNALRARAFVQASAQVVVRRHPDRLGLGLGAGSSAASTRGRSASVTSTWRGLEPS